MTSSPAISLLELNHLVKNALHVCFPEYYWIRAELSESRESSAGHCYVEFIEKSERNQQIVAKARGTIWANRWSELKPYFESITQQTFSAGIKVLVQVSITFHEQYGFSLHVVDLDPSYTLGDMARNRAEIVKRLQEDGVIDLNKELPLTAIPRRIAIISSATAAGFGDFMNQLQDNELGIHFYTHLFPAIMQGGQTEKSIILALDKIHQYVDLFDAVIIIRGGGATSDLNSFDSYMLAANVAQYPLPVIIGIGHDRDETVLDFVAHTALKTPTAVAAFLVQRMEQAQNLVSQLETFIGSKVVERLDQERQKLERLTLTIPQYVHNSIQAQYSKLDIFKQNLTLTLRHRVEGEHLKLSQLFRQKIELALKHRLESEKLRLSHLEKVVELSDPARLLDKGYAMTFKADQVVTSTRDFCLGDRIKTHLKDGVIESLVTNIEYKK